LSQIARVRYLISELDGPSTPRLGSPWQSLARNERFELWRQPEISPVAAGYRTHLIARGTATWPMLATIARSHEKGLLVLMGDGKGNLPGEDLREAAGLRLLFSPESIATEKAMGSDGGPIEPGDSLLISSKQSRGMLQRFLREHPRLATVPVSYSRPSSEEIDLEIDAGDEPAIVFISEGFHPGWHAYLDRDSGEIPLLRAQMAFMAVPVPNGRHAIRLRFESPRAVRVAETISAVCWLALPVAGIGWIITTRRRPRIDSSPQGGTRRARISRHPTDPDASSFSKTTE
jgi:hypothetical protein